ncbi:MAG TPA: hypothetical protein VF054_05370 [Micromonosporaceae bacterium]
MELPCATCATITLFEQPPCLDGHDECPEWVCVRCGEALLVGPPTQVVVTARVTTRSGYPRSRAA